MNCDANDPIFVLSSPLDEHLIERVKKALAQMEKECLSIGSAISASTAADIVRTLESPGKANNCQWLMDQMHNLVSLIQKEMQGIAFLYIPAHETKFFASKDAPYLFGEEVYIAFPSTHYDVSEAGACLATSRPTASVFHLMRVLELGLGSLGSMFGVSLEHTNWAPAIEAIEKRIREIKQDSQWKALDNIKEIQEQYSQSASYFWTFKDAWRNYTMHSRGKYTEEEAEQLFINIRAFMQKLAYMGLKEMV